MNAYQNNNISSCSDDIYIKENSSAFLQKNSSTSLSFSMTFHDLGCFPWLSMTLAVFHDFPGLENGLTKLHDFPWLSRKSGQGSCWAH